ncbi:hypothetical protein AAGS40_00720 [Paraburkholderia sp. PREW-6R]|uniref:hypothetical protein n=1 Tax=Paraburkholderia sp. PREW-6R TaxID=3141544 RepID=UPI0031F4E22F
MLDEVNVAAIVAVFKMADRFNRSEFAGVRTWLTAGPYAAMMRRAGDLMAYLWQQPRPKEASAAA